MTQHVFMGVGWPDFFLVPVLWVYNWVPVELCFAAKCLKRLSAKGAHEECGFRSARMHMWLKRIVAVRRRRKGHPSWDAGVACTMLVLVTSEPVCSRQRVVSANDDSLTEWKGAWQDGQHDQWAHGLEIFRIEIEHACMRPLCSC
jgi:hypothetical protein